ncbi:unnamed protein product [Didymodactylos carnosus]|uniref:Uncharacterized protein n=1 Tax=Didymodactylos carnosus TaxID=1234261 RepID=A0A815WP92_9BILA|nr:unnamed protein product [Didymodactylos carnosus]CAF4406806.1 unnamed protein product [Didymodactylos carnosus]
MAGNSPIITNDPLIGNIVEITIMDGETNKNEISSAILPIQLDVNINWTFKQLIKEALKEKSRYLKDAKAIENKTIEKLKSTKKCLYYNNEMIGYKNAIVYTYPVKAVIGELVKSQTSLYILLIPATQLSPSSKYSESSLRAEGKL